MPIGDIFVRHVVTTTPDTTIQEAAQLMHLNHVADLVIVDRLKRRVIRGVLTNRDIVAVVARQLDATTITVGDVMTSGLEAVKEDQGIFEVLRQMRSAGVQRLPVVSQNGALAGIISLDDLTQLFVEEMTELSELVSQDNAKDRGQQDWPK